jgi:hypothetical protein
VRYRVIADYRSSRELFVEVADGEDPMDPNCWRDMGWEEKELDLVLLEVISAKPTGAE